jgi:hypothetical protein
MFLDVDNYESGKNYKKYEVRNGLLGMMKDIVCLLAKKLYWHDDDKIRSVCVSLFMVIFIKLIGISGESVLWINHSNFIYSRSTCLEDLKTVIIPNKYYDYLIVGNNVNFNLSFGGSRSIIFNRLIKDINVELYKIFHNSIFF